MNGRRRALLARKASGNLPGEYRQVRWIGYAGPGKYLNTGVSGEDVSVIRVTVARISGADNRTVMPSAFNVSSGAPVSAPYGFLEGGTASAFSVVPAVAQSSTFDFTDFVFTRSAAFQANVGFGYSNGIFCPSLRFSKLTMEDSNGNILFDAIPCYRKSDGAIGLYDTVNSVFRETAGAWTKGDDT